MAWSIKFAEGALKSLKKLDGQVAKRIVSFLKERVGIDEDPRRIGEALEGSRLGEFWKYRVGDYRLVCRIVDSEVVVYVLYVDHRSQVYRTK